MNERKMFMRVNEFIDEFKKAQDKESYTKLHIIKNYLPFAEKISVCNKIAEYTTHKQVQEKKIFSIDSAMRYMLFVFTIVECYTDIELGKDDERMKAFDLLEMNNVMFFIRNCLGDEYARIDTVLKMQVEDIYNNERDLPSFLETKIDAVNLVLERMGEMYEQKDKRHTGEKNKGN